MTRLERKKNLDKLSFKSSGGLLDLFDEALREIYHITDEMYDEFIEKASDEEMNSILELLPIGNPKEITYTQAKKALTAINKYC